MITRTGSRNSIVESIIFELIQNNPALKVKCDVTLNLVRAINRKCSCRTRNCVDRHENNENLHSFLTIFGRALAVVTNFVATKFAQGLTENMSTNSS